MSSLLLSRRTRRLFVLILFCFVSSLAQAQCISLTTLGAASTQNFDTLLNTAKTMIVDSAMVTSSTVDPAPGNESATATTSTPVMLQSFEIE